MEQIYYSTIGLMLDIICLTLPLFLLLKVKYKPLVFVIIYISVFILFQFNINFYVAYLIVVGFVMIISKVKYDISFRNLYITVSSFLVLFIFDTACYLMFEDMQLIIISTIYKMYLIAFYKNVLTDKEISLDLIRKQMLSIIGVSVIIILGVLKGVLYV